jgi:hypothetical protein
MRGRDKKDGELEGLKAINFTKMEALDVARKML